MRRSLRRADELRDREPGRSVSITIQDGGLASVKQIVERLGGHVRAESDLGEGATSYLVLDSKDVT